MQNERSPEEVSYGQILKIQLWQRQGARSVVRLISEEARLEKNLFIRKNAEITCCLLERLSSLMGGEQDF